MGGGEAFRRSSAATQDLATGYTAINDEGLAGLSRSPAAPSKLICLVADRFQVEVLRAFLG